MPFIENFVEFCQRQGCAHLELDRHCLFENGAIWHHQLPISKDPGKGEDPPTGIELTKRLMAYHQHLLTVEEREFQRMKGICELQNEYARANVGPLVTPDMLEYLKDCQKKVLARRKILVPLEAQYAKFMEDDETQKQKTAHQRSRQEQRDQAAQVAEQLKRIAI